MILHLVSVVEGMGYRVEQGRGWGAQPDLWWFTATDAKGEVFRAGDENRYRAAVMLAVFVGVDVEE